MTPAHSTAEVAALLRSMIAGRTRLPADEVALGAPLASFGLGSVDLIGMVGELEAALGRPVGPNAVWAHPTVGQLAAHLAGDRSDREPPAPVPGPVGEEIDERGTRELVAIVGIGCRLPGGVQDPAGLWDVLLAGRDTVGPVPDSRWDGRSLVGDSRMPGALLTDQGGFVDEADRFDHAFFGISPREAERMDPQQRLLLEVAWESLQDAGVPVASLAGTQAAVVVGLSNNDFSRGFTRTDADAHTATGAAASLASNRLSYLWDLRGPSLTLDTACSSSLVAIHEAAELVASGRAPVALAGGASLLLEPDVNAAFTKMGVLSPRGRCQPFSADADGIVRSEGAVVVVLKRLTEARADGDRIYCVVRGGAVNQDGRTNGLTAPNPTAQEDVLRRAYRHAGVDPRRVGYVEAHGTGTLLGDPIEASALGAALGVVAEEPLPIGSAKSNFGHTEACAGALGVAKVALMLHHRRFVPTAHLSRPNPRIDFAGLRLALAEGRPWAADRPRVAGVSAFGFGGTNAHLVLEEAVPEATPVREARSSNVAVLVSAPTEEGLATAAAAFATRVDACAPEDLAALATASGARRDVFAHRGIACGHDVESIAAGLRALAAGNPHPGAVRGRTGDDLVPAPVLVFAGQGAGFWPVAADVLAAAPVRSLLTEAQEALASLCDAGSPVPALDELLGSPATDTRLTDPALGQVAFTVLQMGLAALWQSWGVTPAAVVGHSLGEVAAAHAAGALDTAQAVEVALRRGQAIAPQVGSGAMAIVGLAAEELASLLAVAGHGELWIAGINGPHTCVVSGTHAAMDRLVPRLEQSGTFVRRIIEESSYPSHSPLMQGAAGRLARALDGLTPRAGAIPLHSTVLGSRIPGDAMDAEYWARNLVSPVLFDRVVASLAEAGHERFVEVSAREGLSVAIRDRLDVAGRTGLAVPTLRKEAPGLDGAVLAAVELAVVGVHVDWGALHGTPPRHVELPAQRWAATRFPLHGGSRGSRGGGHPLLGTAVRPAGQPGRYLWSADLDAKRLPWLSDHRVGGAAIVPGALWLETLASVSRRTLGSDVAVENLRLLRPTLVTGEATSDTVQVDVVHGGSTLALTVFTRHGEDWVKVATATARAVAVGLPEPADGLLAGRMACRDAVGVDDLYAALARAGLDYGDAFRGLDEAWVGPAQGLARLRSLPDLVADAGEYLVHPVILDAALQVVAVAASATRREPLVPASVDSLRLTGGMPAWVRACLDEAEGRGVRAHLELFDEDGTTVGILDGVHFVPAEAGPTLADAVWELGWQPPRVAPHLTSLHGTWLHLHAGDDDGAALARGLGGAGASLVSLDVRAEDWVTALATAVGSRPVGILHTVGTAPVPTGDALPSCVDRVVVSLLDLAHALAAVGVEPQRTVVCTRGVHGPGNSAASVAGGAAWGFARSLAVEAPALRVVLLDLGTAGAESASDALLRVAGGEGDDTGQWLVTPEGLQAACLRPVDPMFPRPWPRGPFLEQGWDNATILAENPGILDSLAPVATVRRAPGPDEVEVEVAAAGLNFNDVLKALDTCPGVTPGVNALGAECSGVVARVGREVLHVRPGDRVVAVGQKAMSAWLTTPASHAVSLPDHVDLTEAAGIPIVFLTAVYGLEHLARLRAGETVLVHSATGGVGVAALHVARRRGARILVTAGTPEKRAALESQGLGPVMDSRSLDFIDQVRELTGGRGVDVVLNFLTGPALVGGLSLLAPGGRFVEIGKQDIYADHPLGLGLLRGNRSFLAVDLEQVIRDDPALLRQLLGQVMAGFRNGDFTPVPCEAHSFSDAVAAFGSMARAEHRGKVLLRPDGVASGPVALRPGPAGRHGARLVTGGLGALGLRTAGLLVDRGARHLVLAGRHAPSARAQEAIAAWRQAGVRVDVVALDVTDGAAVGAWVDGLDIPLVGIYHAAGVLDDGAIENLDADRCRHVLAPKIMAAWHLHRATLGRPVGEFVLYSSAAGLLGSPGQANYAAANTALDALAHYRVGLGLPCLSVQWGPWLGDGLAGGPDGGATSLTGVGVSGIEPALGTSVLGIVAESGLTHACVLPVDRARLALAVESGLVPPLLAGLAARSEGAPTARSGLREQWEQVPVGLPRRQAVQRYLCEQIGLVLRQEAARVDPTRALSSMGFDSLMSLELRRRLERTAGVDLPATLVWRHPTVEALVPFVADAVGIGLDAPVTAAAREEAPPVPMVVDDDDLDLMTGEQLEQLLRSTIEQESHR